MKMRIFFQKNLVKRGGSFLFGYVKNHRLEDEVVNFLISEERDDILQHYVKYHTLSTDQITEVLFRETVGDLMLEVVRINILTPKQQELIIEKKNVLLLEAYLSPKGFFDCSRRFNTLPEYLFIYNMIKSDKLTGVELFKTYVDNCYRTLLTEDLIDLLIQNETAFATKYIFRRAKLRREWEADFVKRASETMLKIYIEEHEFGSDAGQLELIQKSDELAKIYYEKHKFRPAAQSVYFNTRQQKCESPKSEV